MDSEFLDWVRSINERFCNASRSEDNLTHLLEKNYLDENVSDKSLRLVPKTENSQICQYYVVALPWAGYGKSQKEKKDYQENKINPIVGGSSDTKASVYYHIIDWY